MTYSTKQLRLAVALAASLALAVYLFAIACRTTFVSLDTCTMTVVTTRRTLFFEQSYCEEFYSHRPSGGYDHTCECIILLSKSTLFKKEITRHGDILWHRDVFRNTSGCPETRRIRQMYAAAAGSRDDKKMDEAIDDLLSCADRARG